MRLSQIQKITVGGMLLVSASACGTDDEDTNKSQPTKECPVIVSDADCDKTLRPFVFVHGTYGSGTDFAHTAALLGSNGYCQDRIVGVEYNSLGDSPGTDGNIDAVIDQVLADNPDFDQVDLAGHSQGTAHCGAYLAEPAQAAKVAHYINFSGSPAVGAVPTLSLSSEKDLQDTPHHASGDDVTAVTFKDEDHFAVAASRNAFIEVYKYLVGKEPKYKEVQCGDEMVTVEGIAETFANNARTQGKIEIREMTDTPRDKKKPVITTTSDAEGRFGPFELKRGVVYEFKGFDNNGDLVGYQYFTPFMRSNRLVRMLSPSDQAFIAALSTDHLVHGPNHSALVVRWSGGGFRQDLGGSLKVDGKEVLTSENSGDIAHTNSSLAGGTVGFFMADADENMKSDLNLYYSASFLAFTDVFIDAREPSFVELKFVPGSEDPNVKAQTIKIPNWPSSDADISITFQ